MEWNEVGPEAHPRVYGVAGQVRVDAAALFFGTQGHVRPLVDVDDNVDTNLGELGLEQLRYDGSAVGRRDDEFDAYPFTVLKGSESITVPFVQAEVIEHHVRLLEILVHVQLPEAGIAGVIRCPRVRYAVLDDAESKLSGLVYAIAVKGVGEGDAEFLGAYQPSDLVIHVICLVHFESEVGATECRPAVDAVVSLLHVLNVQRELGQDVVRGASVRLTGHRPEPYGSLVTRKDDHDDLVGVGQLVACGVDEREVVVALCDREFARFVFDEAVGGHASGGPDILERLQLEAGQLDVLRGVHHVSPVLQAHCIRARLNLIGVGVLRMELLSGSDG